MSYKDEFIEEILKQVDKWSFEFCAYCDPGTLVSVEGMLDFKCINCGKHMKDGDYLGEIAKAALKYRAHLERETDDI